MPRENIATRGGPRDRWFQRKNWDDHVSHLETMAGSPGFTDLRDRILALAELREDDRVLDVGSGTGLLALAAAPLTQKVWALDISPAMARLLEAKAAELAVANLETITASASRLPLADNSIDVVVSNYCYHHLNDRDKLTALREARRVLTPGGRLVIGDMMFRVGVGAARDRSVIFKLIATMLRRGPAGLARIAKNALRYLLGRWEHPANVEWWQSALVQAGFTEVSVEALAHEGGIASARRS